MTIKLTQEIDTLAGTTAADVFEAPLFTTAVGTQAPTLQIGDTINGGAGIDILQATVLTDSGAIGAYMARPKLTSVETVKVTSISAATGTGSANQSSSTLDLLQSSGVNTFISDASNNQVDVINAGAISKYVFSNTIADDDEDGLAVKGITATALAVTIDTVVASGAATAVVSFDTQSGTALASITATALSAQFALDADVSGVLTIAAKGHGDVVTLAEPVAQMILKGDSDLELKTVGGSDLVVGSKFDASAMTGPLAVDSTVSGNFSTVLGGGGDDTFAAINSGRTGGFKVDLGQGSNSVGGIVANAATAAAITTGDGNDTLSSVSATGGKLVVKTGGGNDSVTVAGLHAGTSNSFQMGAGNDVLDISAVALDLNPNDGFVDTFNGDAGTNRIWLNTTGLDAAQGSHILHFQVLDLVPTAIGIYDFDGLPSVTQVIVEGAGEFFFDNVKAAVQTTGDGTYHLDPGTHDTASDTLKLAVGTSATAATPGPGNQGDTAFGDFELNDSGERPYETVSITSNGGAFGTTDALAGTFGGTFNDTASDFNLVRFDNQKGIAQVKITGAEDIQLRTAKTTTGDLTIVNAASLSGALDMTANFNTGEGFFGVFVSTAGASITGGAGDDFLAGGSGADTFNLGHGGRDTVLFVHQTDSDMLAGQVDTINGFVAGNDKLAFNGTTGAAGVFRLPLPT